MTPLTKLEFINQLSSKLEVIPINDRENILAYYSNHIQNSEDEVAAIAGLGTPSEVAAEVLASYVKKVSHASHAAPHPNAPVSSYREGHKEHAYHEERRPRLSWPIIVLLIIASPAIIGLTLGLGGGLFGIFIGFWGVIFAFAVSGFAFVATGLVSAVLSIPIFFQDAGFGLVSGGMGLVLVGIGIFLIMLTISIGKWLISLVQTVIQKITRRSGHHERTI